MKIAELFVGLGVKGADQAGKALGGVKTGLGEVKSMSLEAKAAIVGVVYALERMMTQSAQMGTGLLNFNQLTGIGAKELQQWQYAARQAGVSADEMTGSLKAVQNSMTNMLLGKGAPEGMAMLANKVGFDPARARDTLYVMQQLQKFAQSVPKDVGNNMLKSFGLGEGTISAMRRNVFTPDTFAKAPVYGDKEVSQLDKVNVAWGNLGQKIQMAFGHFTSKHGMELVADLSKITTEVVKLADALTTLAEKSKVFAFIGKLIEGLTGATQDFTGYVQGKRSFLGEDLDKNGNVAKKHATGSVWNKIFTEQHAEEYIKDMFKGLGGPSVSPTQPQNVEVNQTLNFHHDGKDSKKTGDSTNKAVKDAFRQLSAQSQGS